MSDAESSDAESSDAKADGCFRYGLDPIIGLCLVVGAMYSTFGAWRRGWETLGVSPSRSFVVAVAVDVLLLAILLGNEAVRFALEKERREGGGGAWLSPRRFFTYMVWAGVVALYGSISLRGGGDMLDLY